MLPRTRWTGTVARPFLPPPGVPGHDARESEIYSLAVFFVEFLEFQRPFPTSRGEGGCQADLVLRICRAIARNAATQAGALGRV